MRQQLVDLRAVMAKHGVDYCLVPSNDFHGSEYLSSHFKARKWVSGFTGSAGTLLVGKDWAGLWTDGRYFLQAADCLHFPPHLPERVFNLTFSMSWDPWMNI